MSKKREMYAAHWGLQHLTLNDEWYFSTAWTVMMNSSLCCEILHIPSTAGENC